MDLEEEDVGFAYAGMGLRISSQTTEKKQGKRVTGEWEDRLFVGSSKASSRSLESWLGVVRGHWAGVEIRNHWQKDASMREDKTRSKTPSIVCNLILLRNVVLWYREREGDTYESFPAFLEDMAANPRKVFRMVTRP